MGPTCFQDTASGRLNSQSPGGPPETVGHLAIHNSGNARCRSATPASVTEVFNRSTLSRLINPFSCTRPESNAWDAAACRSLDRRSGMLRQPCQQSIAHGWANESQWNAPRWLKARVLGSQSVLLAPRPGIWRTIQPTCIGVVEPGPSHRINQQNQPCSQFRGLVRKPAPKGIFPSLYMGTEPN